MDTLATPSEAEQLAKSAIDSYLKACGNGSSDPQLIGNYLMKIASVAGVMMAMAEGSDAAAKRLEGTARFVVKTMPKSPPKARRVQ